MIRQAAPEDAADIAAIWNPVIRETAITFTTEQETNGSLAADITARRRLFLVAGEAGAVTGFATVFRFRAGPGCARSLRRWRAGRAPGAP
ncbi:GNAT family N-acetyltransferase [Rhodosalinus sp.]|uniref:GNAT family N-acetyltransferase n=1 Tax=Rhodosalinus sp. TaxID=2047741 RepID=UPI003979AA34